MGYIKQSIIILWLICLAPLWVLASEETSLTPGRLIEKVVCTADPEQSYALYLPANYSPDRSWPIVYCFDPGARGMIPVDHFQVGAAQYGYIVVGSNNSQNGAGEISVKAARAIWLDTHSRWNINDSRIYLSGFSGGSRVASNIAVALKGQIAGVIGCGAGFPPGLTPAGNSPFAYFGIVGIEDFNYPEMLDLETQLTEAKFPKHLEIFDGGHSWPPQQVCSQALAWLQLSAMKSGLLDKDSNFIDTLFSADRARAQTYESMGALVRAFSSYNNIVIDFDKLKDNSEIANKLTQLSANKEFQQALKQEKEMIVEQKKQITQLLALRTKLGDRGLAFSAGDDAPPVSSGRGNREGLSMGSSSTPPSTPNRDLADPPDARQQSLDQLRSAIADLKKKAESKESKDSKENNGRILARRIWVQFLIISAESANALMQAHKYTQAVASFSLDTEILSDNTTAFYNLACAYALAGNKKKALEALKNAVKKGFNDEASLNSTALDSLKGESDYKKIIGSIKK